MAGSLFALEIFLASFAWGKQKHYSVPQEAEANSLLGPEIVYVLLKLPLLCVVLGDEGDHSLYWVTVHIFTICSVTDI
jgi:hypothetical protein